MDIQLVFSEEKIDVDADAIQLQSEMLDVTTYSDSFRHYIPSGIQTLTIRGMTADGPIEGTFPVKEVVDHRTYILESLAR